MAEPVADGLVVVDKPAGWTSHDVVARVRRLAGTRKVGHAGTLDPMATGILVVGIGRATRLLGHLAADDKTYEATLRLGRSTVTDDAEGDVTGEVSAAAVDEASVRRAAADLVGEIDQVPSSVSAVKVEGKRSYARVRAGEEVVLPPRRVRIDAFEVHEVTRPTDALIDVTATVRCSSGTYIRALARDLGAALGVGGHLTSLRRTHSGDIDLSVARTLDQLVEHFSVLPLADAVRAAFPVRVVGGDDALAVRHGRPLPVTDEQGLTGVFDEDGTVLALMEPRGENLRVVVGFTGS